MRVCNCGQQERRHGRAFVDEATHIAARLGQFERVTQPLHGGVIVATRRESQRLQNEHFQASIGPTRRFNMLLPRLQHDKRSNGVTAGEVDSRLTDRQRMSLRQPSRCWQTILA